MKKILFFIGLSFFLLSCSSDNDSGNNIDPIIGTWEGGVTTEEYTFLISITFNSEGTGLESYNFSTTDGSEQDSGSENFTWENTALNPDFNSLNQTYQLIFTGQEPEIIPFTFSADFQTAYSNDGEREFTKV